MKTFTTAAMNEIKAGTAIVAGAIEILCADPIRLWSGYGQVTLDGHVFNGIGDAGIAQVANGALGGAAQNVTLGLSGVAPEAVALLDASEVRRAPAALYRLIFDGSGTQLLDYHVFTRGRLDPLVIEEVIGGAASIATSIESAARGLGRKGGRMRTDADQRLVKANDGFFKNVAFAGQKTLYWGGKRPATAGAALGGGSAYYKSPGLVVLDKIGFGIFD